MDRIRKNQIYLIIIGSLLACVGYYFYSLHIDSIICLLVSTTGLTLIISGIRYKERSNMKKLEGDERSAYLRSAHFITTMIGFVIVLVGLGGGLLANYMHAGATAFWFLILVFVGTLIMIVGRIVKAVDKTEKKIIDRKEGH